MHFFSSSAAQQRQSIPVYLGFDVEPDGFQLSRTEPPPWTGFDLACEYAERLRSSIESRTGVAPRFGWYFRTDPQIAEVYGRADHILTQHPERIDRLLARGDYLGVHSHPVRWCPRRTTWIHDIEDAAWIADCTKSALDGFAAWQGKPTERFRVGAGYLSNTIIGILDDHGVKVDLGLEPVAGWGLTATEVPTAVDASPLVGPYTNCAGAPREAYRPARHDFRIPAGPKDGRALVMIPMTTYVPESPQSRWRRIVRYLKQVPGPAAQVLYPSYPARPDPKTFWDLAERALRSMRDPYLSFGVRTDAADSRLMAMERQILDALVQHPLCEQLCFTDPLESFSSLLN